MANKNVYFTSFRKDCIHMVETCFNIEQLIDVQSTRVPKAFSTSHPRPTVPKSLTLLYSGSTISTLLHDKINPKDCQVFSLGDSGFLQFLRVVSSDYGKPRYLFSFLVKRSFTFKAIAVFCCTADLVEQWTRFQACQDQSPMGLILSVPEMIHQKISKPRVFPITTWVQLLEK